MVWSTTLSADIGPDDQEMRTAALPTGHYPVAVTIDEEIVLVTAGLESGPVPTIQRGAYGSARASHTAGAVVARFAPGGNGAHPNLATHTALGLAATAHGHAIADTTNLQSSLDAKADSHSHPYAATSHSHAGENITSGTVADGRVASTIARDSELPDLAGHVAAADPHTGYVREADANWTDLTDGGATTLHTHAGGGGEAFPIGAVFIAVVSTNPATLLGYGTWAAFGAGRVLIGLDAGDADFDTVEETGGAKTKSVSAHAGSAVAAHSVTQPDPHTDVINHTHATDSQGAHVHDEYNNSATTGGLVGWGARDTSTNTPTITDYDTGSAGAHTHTAQNPAGGVASIAHAGAAVDAHQVTQPSAHSDLNVVQPYIVVYMWKRTA